MVWGQELRRDRIYLDDDFFQIGGDSLSGVRTCARISEMLEAKVDLALLFRRPSLRDFAGALTSSDRVDHWLNLTPIRLSGPYTPFVCVHGDEGNYNLPRLFSDDRPFIGFMHQGEDGKGMRYKTIRSMARHYVNGIARGTTRRALYPVGFSTGGSWHSRWRNAWLPWERRSHC
ncbi:MAG: phosphopantetheine-binding protein [Flavobacteriales bacterium]